MRSTCRTMRRWTMSSRRRSISSGRKSDVSPRTIEQAESAHHTPGDRQPRGAARRHVRRLSRGKNGRQAVYRPGNCAGRERGDLGGAAFCLERRLEDSQCRRKRPAPQGGMAGKCGQWRAFGKTVDGGYYRNERQDFDLSLDFTGSERRRKNNCADRTPGY